MTAIEANRRTYSDAVRILRGVRYVFIKHFNFEKRKRNGGKSFPAYKRDVKEMKS